VEADKKISLDSIRTITNTSTKPLVASSGLSIQYTIMMGLIHDAVEKHKGKAIKIIVKLLWWNERPSETCRCLY
jgi:hypothetical protein